MFLSVCLSGCPLAGQMMSVCLSSEVCLSAALVFQSKQEDRCVDKIEKKVESGGTRDTWRGFKRRKMDKK